MVRLPLFEAGKRQQLGIQYFWRPSDKKKKTIFLYAFSCGVILIWTEVYTQKEKMKKKYLENKSWYSYMCTGDNSKSIRIDSVSDCTGSNAKQIPDRKDKRVSMVV